jgi:UDP-glucose:(heptosyl)LPS alpha-1,3-glucosyltransferase
LQQQFKNTIPKLSLIFKPPSPRCFTKLQRDLSKQVPHDGGTIGFIGKEWARKGFEQFMRIAQQLHASRPNIKLLVLGPEKEQVKHLCANYSGDISFLGWQASANYYQELDLLIHPASSEAYGMVISEAMASSVPVLVSSACGAASDVSSQHGSVLDLQNSSGCLGDSSKSLA